MVLVFVVVMVEAGVATDVFLNHDWEKVKILHVQALTYHLKSYIFIIVVVADYF